MGSILVKFLFSKKSTKINETFTVDLTLCRKCQIDGEDFIIFCGLLTNHKLTLQCNHLKRKGKCFRIKIINSKALRCTFLGNRKTCLAQNLCNLSYLISQRQEHQRTMQLKVFTCISNFFGPYSKIVLCQSPCSLRPCISRPYCIRL